MPPTTLPEAHGNDAQATSLRAGRMLFARYTLERVLGRGAMGMVWLAHDRNLGRWVALKLLSEAMYSNPAARDALKRETGRSVELAHANIVRVHDFVEDGEEGAIALEYIDGATMTQLRLEHRQHCLEVGGLGSWVGELCRAIHYAHEIAHTVHGDIKPSNILITSRGVLKVADFGLASALRREVVNPGDDVASLGYMSPQQHRGEPATPADDIYSIGATLYEALTSKPPIHSGDIALQVHNTIPESMLERRLLLGVAGELIPQNWEDTIFACLEKEPANRPASVQELARRLEVEFVAAPPPVIAAAEDRVSEITLAAHSVAAPERAEGKLSSVAAKCIEVCRPLAMAISSSAALLWRDKERVASSVAAIVAEKGGVAWKWLGERRNLAPGAMVVAAVVVVVAASWPRHEETKETRAIHKESAPAIPAYAITAPVATATGATGAPEAGGIVIRSNPPGATVRVDGVATELTPASVKGVAPGEHAVAVDLVGFDKVSLPTVVRGGKVTDLGTIALQRSSGKLEVTTDPPGALIRLGERELGRTPLTVKLSSGAYRGLTAHLEGYVDTTFDATVTADETLTMPPMMLKPAPASLTITTDPPRVPFQLFQATVETPGAQPVVSSITPATIPDLRSGTYRVVFGGASAASRSVTVEVGERGTTPVHGVLPQGTLKVESTPPGAEVFDGDRSIGVTPLKTTLLEGTHVITSELNDRTARPRTVKVAANEVESLRFDFTTSPTTPKSSASRRPKKKAPEEGTFTKLTRSIKNIFN